MKKLFKTKTIFFLSCLLLLQLSSFAQSVFINEFTYDYEGDENPEFIEIFGPTDVSLSKWSIWLYDGATGKPYAQYPFPNEARLDKSCPQERDNFGLYTLYLEGDHLRNDGPHGIALVDNKETVRHFISYEGSLTATDGPAKEMTSIDVGVVQSDYSSKEESIQLVNGEWHLVKATPKECNEKQLSQPNNHPNCPIVGRTLLCDGEKSLLTVVGKYDYYKWSDGSDQAQIEVGAGTYSVLAYTDKDKCHSSIRVTAFPALSCRAQPTDAKCADTKTGSIEVLGDGGSGFFEYSIDGQHYQTNGLFSNLAAGSYSVIVRDIKAPHCTSKCTATIKQPEAMITEFTTNGACGGSDAGSILVTATGGTPPYFYSINGSDFQASHLFENVETGVEHNITVLDDNKCAGTWFVTVEEGKPLSCRIDTKDASCFGEKDGTIVVNVEGGSGKFDYLLGERPVQESPVFEGLAAGNYEVRVIDKTNPDCQTTCKGSIFAPETMLVETKGIEAASDLNTADGTAKVNLEKGTLPYFVSWAGPVEGNVVLQSEGVLTVANLIPGHYTLTVVDGNSCIRSIDFVVPQRSMMECEIVGETEICLGTTTTLSVEGEYSSYLWSTGDNSPSVEVEAGTYTLAVSDGISVCEAEISVVHFPNPPVASATSDVDATAMEVADGEAEIVVSGGQSPYSLDWSGRQNGMLSLNAAGTETLTELLPGVYAGVVTDANGCEASFSFVVESETPFVCSGGDCVEISTDVVGDYCYHLVPEENVSEINETSWEACPNETTTYILTVTDAEGNFIYQQEYNIEVIPETDDVSILPSNPSFCTGGSVILDAGENFVQYEWSTGANTQQIEATTSGIYSVIVSNEFGCTSEAVVNVTESNTDLEVQIEASQYGMCNIPTIVELTAIPSDENVTYNWSTGANTQQIEVFQPATYSVTITDNAQNCQATTSIVIGDFSDENSIFSMFESNGFFKLPITILGEEVLRQGNSDICDINCEGSFCVSDAANFQIKIHPSLFDPSDEEQAFQAIIDNLENLVLENLQHFTTEFGYSTASAFITKNDNFCECPDYFTNIQNEFNNSDLAFWIHLWDAPDTESADDWFFILANVPTQENHYPISPAHTELLHTMLDNVYVSEYTGSFNRISERSIFALQDLLLDNYLSDFQNILAESSSLIPVCENTLVVDEVAIAPSGIPVRLPMNASLQFTVNENWPLFSPPPSGALLGFTEFVENTAKYYTSRVDMSTMPIQSAKFLGYYKMTLKDSKNNGGNENNEDELPYQSNSNFSSYPRVILGKQEQFGSNENAHIILEKWQTQGSFPLASGAATFCDDNIISEFPADWFGTLVPPEVTITEIDLPPITELDLSDGQVFYEGTDYEGLLKAVPNENGGTDYIFAYVTTTITGVEQITYLRWNCFTGSWENLDVTDVNLTGHAAFELTAHQNNEDGSGNENNNNNNSLHGEEIACYDISAEDAGTINSALTGTPSISDNIVDFAGLNETQKNQFQQSLNLALSRYNHNMIMLISAYEGTPLDTETPPDPNESDTAGELFYDAGSMDGVDVLFWLHIREDGTIGLCFRFAENFFVPPIADDAEGNLAQEVEEIKGVAFTALRDAIVNKEADLQDTNAANDVDDMDAIIAPNATSGGAWHTGLRPNQPEEVNFISVSKEVLGVVGETVKNVEIPKRIWEQNGESMFEVPGGFCGVGQGLAEENPVVATAQMVSFGISFVKDEATRDGLIEAVKSPLKTAHAIYKAKKDIYTGDDVKAIHFELGLDGVTAVVAILTGGASLVDYLKTLKKDAKGTSDDLADNMDDLPDADPFDPDDFYDTFDSDKFEGPHEVGEFLEFIGGLKPYEVHWKKFEKKNGGYPDLVFVWKQFKDIEGLQDVFKAFPAPTNTNFYDKFFEIFQEGDNFADKTGDFLVDMQTSLNSGNNEFANIFNTSSGGVKLESWDVLFVTNSGFRLDVSILTKLSSNVDLLNVLKNNIDEATSFFSVRNSAWVGYDLGLVNPKHKTRMDRQWNRFFEEGNSLDFVQLYKSKFALLNQTMSFRQEILDRLGNSISNNVLAEIKKANIFYGNRTTIINGTPQVEEFIAFSSSSPKLMNKFNNEGIIDISGIPIVQRPPNNDAPTRYVKTTPGNSNRAFDAEISMFDDWMRKIHQDTGLDWRIENHRNQIRSMLDGGDFNSFMSPCPSCSSVIHNFFNVENVDDIVQWALDFND